MFCLHVHVLESASAVATMTSMVAVLDDGVAFIDVNTPPARFSDVSADSVCQQNGQLRAVWVRGAHMCSTSACARAHVSAKPNIMGHYPMLGKHTWPLVTMDASMPLSLAFLSARMRTPDHEVHPTSHGTGHE